MTLKSNLECLILNFNEQIETSLFVNQWIDFDHNFITTCGKGHGRSYSNSIMCVSIMCVSHSDEDETEINNEEPIVKSGIE